MKHLQLNTFWSEKIVRLLYKKGVAHACISPGSRNAPLVSAFLKHSKIKCFSHIDERSNAFFALGLAKQTLKPVVLLTTSGTATANLLPAVIEGYYTMNPLFVITADRPEKLMNTGENQTIDQTNIFGDYVRKTENFNKIKSKIMLKKIDDLLNISLGYNSISGPVHLNIRFDEPLIDNDKIKISYTPKIVTKENKNISFSITKFKKPLIVCGELSDSKPNDILKLSKKLNCTILADPLSNLRHYNNKNILVFYDHYIDKLDETPDCIIRFGKKPTSKKLCSFISKFKKYTCLIDSNLSFNDDCPNVIKASLENLNIIFENNINQNWTSKLIEIEKKTKELIHKLKFKNNSEISLIRTIRKKLNHNDYLFIGNSMPIRIFDQFSGKLNHKINIFANRGASGIDGIISTALGMSYNNKKTKNYLIIGDVSLFHDINAFHILNGESIDLTIIAINNNGGQIFSRLPYSNNNIKEFQKFWITPPFTNIKDLAKLFKLKYYNLKIKEFDKSLNRISNIRGIKLIEVNINSENDIKIVKELNKKINLI